MKFGYRAKIVIIVIGSLIGLISLLYTNYIARELAVKEKQEIALWARAIPLQNRTDTRSQIELRVIREITKSISTSIPAIITDSYLQVVDFQQVDTSIINNPRLLRQELEDMASAGRTPINIRANNGKVYTVFYDDSRLLKGMYFFPYLQLLVIGVFVFLIFISYSSSKDSEQNRVWVGLAKETAHQLGTPTSSLLGWIEFLRTQPLAPEIVDDINRDVTRLTKVVDRFSKIGAKTPLEPKNVQSVVARTVDYFSSRVPRGVTLEFDRHSSTPYQAMLNSSLFEWVLENLLKNALDAIGAKGSIRVSLLAKEGVVFIDVTDTGKGMTPATQRRVFNAGFTTKTRGWGLGLSLSRRIITEFHKGRIFVHKSEIDKGTTMRIALKRL
ncbi:MAG: ATP-binding protein [Rikenellaceae bacterium]